jgi:hypothetical protein
MSKETLEILNTIFGFGGDAISFAGAFMIAWKEAGEYNRVLEEIVASEVYKENPGFQKVVIEDQGVAVRGPEDVKMSLAKRASNISRQGAGVLALGFVFLLVARMCETIGRHRYN